MLEIQRARNLLFTSVPKNLIGCLWLQFAKALEGKDYRQCENCKLWFEIGGSRGARADKSSAPPLARLAYIEESVNARSPCATPAALLLRSRRNWGKTSS